MNYLAHARPFLDQPYFVAGVAIPDWINVVDRKLRVRSRNAQPFVSHHDSQLAAIARGIVQHHEDDGWFHQTRAFTELSLEFTVAIREILESDDGMRVSFLGHLLVEILLDAHLADRQPRLLDDYYRSLSRVNPAVVADAVGRMSNRIAEPIVQLIPRFIEERFLSDYADDDKLLRRLNQVMKRVRLVSLPDRIVEVFPTARCRVAQRATELLAPGEK
ncbi:MAG: hypothetical protein WBF93_08340 [Pirellulales bacterium]